MNQIAEEILEFMKTRPQTAGIIGYGSGVNPQKGQEKRLTHGLNIEKQFPNIW